MVYAYAVMQDSLFASFQSPLMWLDCAVQYFVPGQPYPRTLSRPRRLRTEHESSRSGDEVCVSRCVGIHVSQLSPMRSAPTEYLGIGRGDYWTITSVQTRIIQIWGHGGMCIVLPKLSGNGWVRPGYRGRVFVPFRKKRSRKTSPPCPPGNG